MSRKRNRHRSLSHSMVEGQNNLTSKKSRGLFQSTTNSQWFKDTNKQISKLNVNLDLHNQEKNYNRNISKYRQNFNQNDNSQLPFMSSLREGHKWRSTERNLGSTVCQPFEAALKNTSNQIIKKRISDFAAKSSRLTPSYYRWHNKSGRNNKWGAEFECSLRDYGEGKNPEEKMFSSYIKPIVYNDVEAKYFDKRQLICDRQIKSFRLK